MGDLLHGYARTRNIARLTRTGMVESLRQDYIRTAHAEGLPEWRVILVHALRGGIFPVVSFSGPALAFLITGTVVVERIFSMPGLGGSGTCGRTAWRPATILGERGWCYRRKPGHNYHMSLERAAKGVLGVGVEIALCVYRARALSGVLAFYSVDSESEKPAAERSLIYTTAAIRLVHLPSVE